MRRIALFVACAVLASVGLASASNDRAIGDTRLWERMPFPGMPEGIAVRDGKVYVTTHASIAGNGGGPASRVLVYDLETKRLIRSRAIQGQNLSGTHGLLAMAFDADGNLYVVDRSPSRVIKLDPALSTQTDYARFPELPACRPAGPTTGCSPTTADQPNFTDYIAFDPAGNMYVTDLDAATIWRITPRGEPQIWYQDARFDSVFGLNGIAVDPSGTTLYFAMTGSLQPTTPGQGIIYTLPIVDRPVAVDLKVFHTFTQPAAGPDGIAFGASGNLYVALAGANQVAILNPDGSEAAIFPDPVANQQMVVPYDLPASIAFDGRGSILVTNQSYFFGNENNWAVLDAWVGDTALALHEPDLS